MQGHEFSRRPHRSGWQTWGVPALLVLAIAMEGGCARKGETRYTWDDDDESMGGATGAGASGNANGSDDCDPEWSDVPSVPNDLILVVDRSGSMNCNGPSVDPDCAEPVRIDSSEPSRWEILRQSVFQLDGFFEQLKSQRTTRVGLQSFPTDSDCGVPDIGDLRVPLYDPTPVHRDELESVWDDGAAGRGPLSGTLLRTLETVRQQVHEGSIELPPALVVLTDGGESCQESALESLRIGIDDASSAYGFRTYVVGLPGSQSARALLSELAFLGNTGAPDCTTDAQSADEACHFDLSKSQDMSTDVQDALTNIASAESRCVFSLPDVWNRPTDVLGLRMSSDAENLLPERSDLDSCSDKEGFFFLNDTRRVALCPASCSSWQESQGSYLQAARTGQCGED